MFRPRIDSAGKIPGASSLMKDDRFRVPLIALVLSLALLAASSFFGPRGPVSVNRNLVSDEGRYRLKIFSILSPGDVIPGNVYLSFEKDILSLDVVLDDPFTRRVSPAGIEPRRLTNRVFRFPADGNLHRYVVEIIPRHELEGRLKVKFELRPERTAVFLIGFSVLSFFLALFLLWSLLLAVKIVGARAVPALETRRAALAFLALFFLFLLGAVGRLPALSFFLIRHEVPLLKVLAANLGAAFGIALLYLLLRRIRIPLPALAVLLALLSFPVFLSYNMPVCGDGQVWIAVLHEDAWLLRAAEFLSYPLVKIVFFIGRGLRPGFSALQAWIGTGKAFGVLWLLAVACYVQARPGLSKEKRLLFFLLTVTLPATVFFLGYPEFAHYALPFLLMAAVMAEKYLGRRGRRGHLAGAAAFIAGAGLMHAVAFVSLPPLILAPFLKKRDFKAGKKTGLPAWRESLVPLAVGLAAAGAALGAAAAWGVPVSFDTVLGGGDGEMFVNISRPGEGQTLFGPAYKQDRAWFVMTAFPLALFLAARGRDKWKALREDDLVLFLLGLPQLVLLFFWNYDLGFRDFDLYIAPLTMMNMFLIARIVDREPDAPSLGRRLLLISAFALTSPAILLLFMTSAAPF